MSTLRQVLRLIIKSNMTEIFTSLLCNRYIRCLPLHSERYKTWTIFNGASMHAHRTVYITSSDTCQSSVIKINRKCYTNTCVPYTLSLSIHVCHHMWTCGRSVKQKKNGTARTEFTLQSTSTNDIAASAVHYFIQSSNDYFPFMQDWHMRCRCVTCSQHCSSAVCRLIGNLLL